jgi:hypothetical protein
MLTRHWPLRRMKKKCEPTMTKEAAARIKTKALTPKVPRIDHRIRGVISAARPRVNDACGSDVPDVVRVGRRLRERARRSPGRATATP